MPAFFERFKDVAGQYRFRLKAANGEPVMTSESYPTKQHADRAIADAQAAAIEATSQAIRVKDA